MKTSKKEKTDTKASGRHNGSKDSMGSSKARHQLYVGHAKTIEVVENLTDRLSTPNHSADGTQERNIDEEIENRKRKTSEVPIVGESPLFTSSPIKSGVIPDSNASCDLAEGKKQSVFIMIFLI